MTGATSERVEPAPPQEDAPSSQETPSSREPHRKRRRRSRLSRLRGDLQQRSALVLSVLLALAVVGSLLAVGTVHVEALLAVAPVCLIAGAFALFVEERPERRLALPALILAALAGYSWLQSVPLPQRWLGAISPVAAQTWTDAFKLVGEPMTRWASVSVDPSASRVEALKWFCYAAVFLAASRLTRERGIQSGAILVVASALLGGLLSIGHGLLGEKDWMGLYHPQMAGVVWAPAPLLNPNNFAGYLNLALFAGMGLLFARKPVVSRWVIGLCIVVLAALVVLTGSRGGVLALILGFGASGVAFRQQQVAARERGGGTLPAWIPLVGVVLAATGLAIIGATDLVWQQLLDETTGKLRMIEYSQPVIRDHLWTGIGRGAFETAFAAYRQEPGNYIAQYAENFAVQWIVEWGIPVAALGLVGLVWSLRPRSLAFGRNAVPTGIVLGIVVLLFQNLVDLATEVTSVGIAVAVLLGSLTGGAAYLSEHRIRERSMPRSGRSANESPTSTPRDQAEQTPAAPIEHRPEACVRTPPVSSKWTAVAALGCLAIGASLYAFAAKYGRPDAIDSRNQLAEALTSIAGKPSTHSDVKAARAKLTTALLRHPGDPYMPVVGALLARESGASTLVWLNHALRRDPLNARAHLLLADALAARGAMAQALLQLRKATEYGPELRSAALDRAVRWTPDLENLLRIVPEGGTGIAQLNALAQRLQGKPERAALRTRFLELSLARNPRESQTNAIYAQDLLNALAADAEPCKAEKRSVCLEKLKHYVDMAIRGTSDQQLKVALAGRQLAVQGRLDEAERLLADRCHEVPNPAACNRERVGYALKLKDSERFEAAAATYTASACTTPASCSGALEWLGHIEMGRNNLHSALSRFERAAHEAPSAGSWMRVADVALRLKRLGRVQTALAAARRFGAAEKLTDFERRLVELQREQLLRESGAGARPSR